MMWWGDGYMMGWWWVLGGFLVLVVVVLAIVGAMAAARRGPQYPGQPMTHAAPASPRQILDERYAKGELTTDEYRERIENLGAGS